MAIAKPDSQIKPTESPRITGRSILLGLLTAGLMAYAQNVLEIVLHPGIPALDRDQYDHRPVRAKICTLAP